jgi:two-component system sensor histidine kinase EvgS
MTLWRLLVSLSLACLCNLASADLRGQANNLTSEEQAWVASHPVVRMAVISDSKPVQYMEDGEIKGLAAQYLPMLARNTGTAFRYVEVGNVDAGAEMLRRGQVDAMSVMRPVGAPLEEHGLLYTRTRIGFPLLVVTRAGERFIPGIQELNGKKIATALHPYIDKLSAALPDSKLTEYTSALDLLTAVANGTADAGVSTQLHTLPYLYRRFKGVLQISGVLSEYSSQYTFAVRADDPVMYAVMQKALLAVSGEDLAGMYDRWLDADAFDAPSFKVLAQEYMAEFVLLALIALLLAGLVYQAHRQRLRAIRNERDKARFLAVMSHEVRSPMNAILAAVELLERTPLSGAQRRLAGMADRAGRALLGLLDDVLDYSRLEARQLKLAPAPVDINAFVHRVAQLHRADADEKKLALTVHAAADACWLLLDEASVARVLNILLSNAVRFTEAGGIDVRVGCAPGEASSQASAQESSPSRGHVQLAISVADTGIGIVPQNQALLFKPYAQAANTYKRSGGTGLGLALCRELALLMGGTLSLASEPGKGTTVTLSLRAQTTTPAPIEPPPDLGALAAPSGHGALAAPSVADADAVRILLVEDAPANQEAIRAQVRSFGCTLRVAGDGAQALALFASEQVDLVLMDCELPGQDGYAVAGAMRRMEVRPARVPILAISAATGTAHTERCLDAGMDGVLSKPIRLAKLRNAIELWCDVSLEPAGQAVQAVDPVAQVATLPQVRDALSRDLRDLLRAVALRDADAALRAAHRLHGAALTLGWAEVAQPAGRIESLLRAQVPWHSEDYAALLARLVAGGPLAVSASASVSAASGAR